MHPLCVSLPVQLFMAGAICNFISQDKAQTLDTEADLSLLSPSLCVCLVAYFSVTVSGLFREASSKVGDCIKP